MPAPHKPEALGRTLTRGQQQQRLGLCLPVADSSPVNASLLHHIWHNFSWLQLAGCEYLLNLSQGHGLVHPNYDRSGGEAAMASRSVTHID